jgi:serine/threonine protein kinase
MVELHEVLDAFNTFAKKSTPDQQKKGVYLLEEKGDGKLKASTSELSKQPSARIQKVDALFKNIEWRELTPELKKKVTSTIPNYRKVAENIAKGRSWSWKKIALCGISMLCGVGLIGVPLYCLLKKKTSDYLKELLQDAEHLQENIKVEQQTLIANYNACCSLPLYDILKTSSKIKKMQELAKSTQVTSENIAEIAELNQWYSSPSVQNFLSLTKKFETNITEHEKSRIFPLFQQAWSILENPRQVPNDPFSDLITTALIDVPSPSESVVWLLSYLSLQEAAPLNNNSQAQRLAEGIKQGLQQTPPLPALFDARFITFLRILMALQETENTDILYRAGADFLIKDQAPLNASIFDPRLFQIVRGITQLPYEDACEVACQFLQSAEKLPDDATVFLEKAKLFLASRDAKARAENVQPTKELDKMAPPLSISQGKVPPAARAPVEFTLLDVKERIKKLRGNEIIPADVLSSMKQSKDPIVQKICKDLPQDLSNYRIENFSSLVSRTLLNGSHFSVRDLKQYLNFFPAPLDQEAAIKKMEKMNPLIQQIDVLRKENPGMPIFQVIDQVLERKFQDTMDSLCEQITSAKKVGILRFSDIERLVRMEKRFGLEWSDKEIQELVEKIPAQCQDPLVAMLIGKKTRSEFMETYKKAAAKQTEEIDKILANKELSLEQIQLAIGMGPNESQVNKILRQSEKNMPQLLARYGQIERATETDFEKTAPSKRRLLEVALYIEQKKDKFQEISAVFTRRMTGLAFTIQTAAIGEETGIFLIARKKLSTLTGVGSLKAARAAALVFLNNPQQDQTVEPMVRIFTKPQEMTEEELTKMEEEVQIALQYQGMKGFPLVFGPIVYEFNPSGNFPIWRLAFMTVRRDCVEKVFKTLPKDASAGLCDDLVSAIATLHRDGRIHGDAKLDNYLCATIDGKTHLELTDFGQTEMIEKREAPQGTPNAKNELFKTPTKGNYGLGIYGTFRGPPWFAGKKDYHGNPFLVESFAVGMDMWRMFYREPAPASADMSPVLARIADGDDPATFASLKVREAWCKTIKEAIAKKRESGELAGLTWETAKTRSPEIQLKFLMLELVEPDEQPNGQPHRTVRGVDNLLHPKPIRENFEEQMNQIKDSNGLRGFLNQEPQLTDSECTKLALFLKCSQNKSLQGFGDLYCKATLYGEENCESMKEKLESLSGRSDENYLTSIFASSPFR